VQRMLWQVLAVVLLVAAAVGVVVERAVTKTQIRTIADVRSSHAEGGTAALQGTITFAENNRFVLQDGTGRIELSTCPVWYKRISLHEGEHVTVVGQVMRNQSLSAESDFVLSVYKVYRGSEVLEVRRSPGKPPWASHRSSESASPGSFWP